MEDKDIEKCVFCNKKRLKIKMDKVHDTLNKNIYYACVDCIDKIEEQRKENEKTKQRRRKKSL